MKITVAGKVKEYEDGLNITQLIEKENVETPEYCLLYTSPSPRDMRRSRMPSSA